MRKTESFPAFCRSMRQRSIKNKVNTMDTTTLTTKLQPKLKDISKPSINDVLCGSGNYKNTGNSRFHDLIAKKSHTYRILSTSDGKSMLLRSIVDTIYQGNPAGRFLQQDNETGLWFDIGYNESLKKTCFALNVYWNKKRKTSISASNPSVALVTDNNSNSPATATTTTASTQHARMTTTAETKATTKEKENLKDISKPSVNDVTCGRSNKWDTKQMGNMKFYNLITNNSQIYRTSSKEEGRELVCSIVDSVRQGDPAGRFLQQNDKTRLWFDIGYEQSCKKPYTALKAPRRKLKTTTTTSPPVAVDATARTVSLTATKAVDGEKKRIGRNNKCKHNSQCTSTPAKYSPIAAVVSPLLSIQLYKKITIRATATDAASLLFEETAAPANKRIKRSASSFSLSSLSSLSTGSIQRFQRETELKIKVELAREHDCGKAVDNIDNNKKCSDDDNTTVVRATIDIDIGNSDASSLSPSSFSICSTVEMESPPQSIISTTRSQSSLSSLSSFVMYSSSSPSSWGGFGIYADNTKGQYARNVKSLRKESRIEDNNKVHTAPTLSNIMTVADTNCQKEKGFKFQEILCINHQQNVSNNAFLDQDNGSILSDDDPIIEDEPTIEDEHYFPTNSHRPGSKTMADNNADMTIKDTSSNEPSSPPSVTNGHDYDFNEIFQSFVENNKREYAQKQHRRRVKKKALITSKQKKSLFATQKEGDDKGGLNAKRNETLTLRSPSSAIFSSLPLSPTLDATETTFVPGILPNFWQCPRCINIPFAKRARHSVFFHGGSTHPTPADHRLVEMHLLLCNTTNIMNSQSSLDTRSSKGGDFFSAPSHRNGYADIDDGSRKSYDDYCSDDDVSFFSCADSDVHDKYKEACSCLNNEDQEENHTDVTRIRNQEKQLELKQIALNSIAAYNNSVEDSEKMKLVPALDEKRGVETITNAENSDYISLLNGKTPRKANRTGEKLVNDIKSIDNLRKKKIACKKQDARMLNSSDKRVVITNFKNIKQKNVIPSRRPHKIINTNTKQSPKKQRRTLQVKPSPFSFSTTVTATMNSSSLFAQSNQNNNLVYPTIDKFITSTRDILIMSQVKIQHDKTCIPPRLSIICIHCSSNKMLISESPTALSRCMYRIEEHLLGGSCCPQCIKDELIAAKHIQRSERTQLAKMGVTVAKKEIGKALANNSKHSKMLGSLFCHISGFSHKEYCKVLSGRIESISKLTW
mmetsp:Transcript_7438/g.11061  ORF Transcript_7438/g.11061 Transcript_7438/m.11061 type:complete len:1212 (-) Transcript_7438:322-3957(-)